MYQTLGFMKTGIRLLILAVSVMALSSCGGNKKVTIKEIAAIIESSKHPAHAIVKEIKWVSPSAE